MRVGLIAATLLAASSASAESMRCGRWVVDESATPDELIQKCGEPASKETSEEDVRTPGLSGSIKIGTVKTERWTYDRGRRAPAVLVKIAGGKIRSMERLP